MSIGFGWCRGCQFNLLQRLVAREGMYSVLPFFPFLPSRSVPIIFIFFRFGPLSIEAVLHFLVVASSVRYSQEKIQKKFIRIPYGIYALLIFRRSNRLDDRKYRKTKEPIKLKNKNGKQKEFFAAQTETTIKQNSV